MCAVKINTIFISRIHNVYLLINNKFTNLFIEICHRWIQIYVCGALSNACHTRIGHYSINASNQIIIVVASHNDNNTCSWLMGHVRYPFYSEIFSVLLEKEREREKTRDREKHKKKKTRISFIHFVKILMCVDWSFAQNSVQFKLLMQWPSMTSTIRRTYRTGNRWPDYMRKASFKAKAFNYISRPNCKWLSDLRECPKTIPITFGRVHKSVWMAHTHTHT